MKLNGAGIINMYCLFKGQNTDKAMGGKGIEILGNHIIEIPYYQRPYRWEEDNITNLFNDYNDNLSKTGNPSEYFVGATVSVEDEDKTTFSLVDGQQRTTTLYLMNYVRYIIQLKLAEHTLDGPDAIAKAQTEVQKLSDIYVNLIGNKNGTKFEHLNANISKNLSQLSQTAQTSPENIGIKIAKVLKDNLTLFRTELGLPTVPVSSKEDYKKALHTFFDGEKLCLQYARDCYNDYLLDALCGICLENEKTPSDFSLNISEIENDNNMNYLRALQAIFNNAKEYVQKTTTDSKLDMWDMAKKMVDYLGEIIEHLSFCMILTTDPDDAYTLFEVLNDRALDVDDLELVKNHFYKVYCQHSPQISDSDKNKEIDKLDKLWVEEIFKDTKPKTEKRLIAYLATIFLTQSEQYDNKNDIKCKNEIQRKYTDNTKTYTKDNIEHDFNVFYAMSVLIQTFDIKFQKLETIAIKADNNNSVSITYKTFALLYALKREAVLAALANVILAKYLSDHDQKLNIDQFKDYIEELKNDERNEDPKFIEIHECAFMLWRANILAKDHKTPRNKLATKIIATNGRKGYQKVSDLLTSDIEKSLKSEFEIWINDWSYRRNHLCVKILFLNLFRCTRICDSDSSDAKDYTYDKFQLKKSANTYNLDADKINLDHLEAAKVRAPENAYFMYNDPDKRSEVVNSLGNMMILDSKENNKKNNDPLKDSFKKYYDRKRDYWMYKDIEQMMSNESYFDLEKKIPKKDFFERRKKILVGCFKALLDCDLNQDEMMVQL